MIKTFRQVIYANKPGVRLEAHYFPVNEDEHHLASGECLCRPLMTTDPLDELKVLIYQAVP